MEVQRESDVAERKRQLRKRLLEERAAIGEAQRKHADELLAQQLQASVLFQDAKVVFSYVSFGPEVDTRALIQAALSAGKKVAVPRCVPNTRQLEWHYVESLVELAPGTHGILEPVPDARTRVNMEEIAGTCGRVDSNPEVSPGAIACEERCSVPAFRGRPEPKAVIALVPGLAFDRMGFRLGYGGGYYDRFLADFPGASAGLVREQFLAESLAQQGVLCGFDQPVGYIATENGLYCCRT